MTEDDENAGQREGYERKRNKQNCAKTALQEVPAVDRKVVGAADTLHEGGEDAGGSDEADDEGDDESARGMSAVR